MLASASMPMVRYQRPQPHRAITRNYGRTWHWKQPQPLSIETSVRSRPSTGIVRSQKCISLSRWQPSARRTFLSATAQTILTPPLVFVGLLITLWTYKCMMMVLFQDKIIYMPGMPPFSRSEKIEHYASACKPVQWEEKHIKSLDGTKIALCIGRLPQNTDGGGEVNSSKAIKPKEVVICYFQGNGSSTPPRLPILSSVLKLLQAQYPNTVPRVRFTIIGLAYRGYWTSSGRASQSGIELDAQALLEHVSTMYPQPVTELEVVLWGQSVGAGVATTAAASYLSHFDESKPLIAGLVLETPFSGIKGMLIAMYPQKWLPYRYLSPFLWNHWDSETALRQIAAFSKPPKVLLVPGTRDEIVPAEEADKLEELCEELSLEHERKDVVGALHNETTIRRDGQQSIARFIADITK